MLAGDELRLVSALGVAEWQTFIEHAVILGQHQLVADLEQEQQSMLLYLLARDGYLFYPGHTSLTEGPALARRYYTEHMPTEVSNQE